ncbi:MAG: transcription elongation factor GreA [Gammaproteobacteria bacterium]|nr:MAG: transcription elongation factor GreA [Gammaproteobacteria bacterium]RKZ39212.1 MAG: transcription elongation factor GreA [Gammaproteobacteria bacterium]RKZ74557.1 MAG: transcription elongation factor GreA [Gammaproteobacteria bacterium]
MKKSPMTTRGAQKLREELHELKSVARPNVIQAIAEARALGDLKENAEYHAAREQQSFIEGRIIELEGKLANAEIIDITKINARGKVVFSATVELMNVETEEEVSYQIVGEDEADVKDNRISITSPIARALIAKEEGDVAVVQAPSGNKEYEILEVKYV